ncbi:nuclear transport factor 2 family protein [Burkholderia sp. 3C]
MNATDLLEAHLREMLVDFSAWRALYAEDATMVFVYGASAGVSSPLHGIEAIAAGVKGFLNAVTGFSVKISKLHKIEGEDAVIAELVGAGIVVSTGKFYNQEYVVYLRAEHGRIVLIREYFDPSRVVAAFQS